MMAQNFKQLLTGGCSHESHEVHGSIALYSVSVAFLAEAAEDHQPATSLTKRLSGQNPRSGHVALLGEQAPLLCFSSCQDPLVPLSPVDSSPLREEP